MLKHSANGACAILSVKYSNVYGELRTPLWIQLIHPSLISLNMNCKNCEASCKNSILFYFHIIGDVHYVMTITVARWASVEHTTISSWYADISMRTKKYNIKYLRVIGDALITNIPTKNDVGETTTNPKKRWHATDWLIDQGKSKQWTYLPVQLCTPIIQDW